MKPSLPLVITLFATPVWADETRELDAHEHGVGELNIAIDGNSVAIELHAPGADIVGFEHVAETAEDRSAIETAVATLARPAKLFVLPAAAECTVAQASAELESEREHAEHAEEHRSEEHEHGEEHAEGHDDHEDGDGHSEFHAEYLLTCANPGELTGMTLAYFDTFQNARELEVQVVTSSGAQAFEVKRDAPVLDLRDVTGA